MSMCSLRCCIFDAFESKLIITMNLFDECDLRVEFERITFGKQTATVETHSHRTSIMLVRGEWAGITLRPERFLLYRSVLPAVIPISHSLSCYRHIFLVSRVFGVLAVIIPLIISY